MKGKTRGFIEDIFVLAILALLGWGGYIFFFTKDETTLVNATTIIQSTPLKQQKEKIKLENSLSIVDKTPIKIKKIEANKEIVKLNSEENKINEKIIKETVEPPAKSIDIQILKKFLIDTKQNIRNSIVITNENNEIKKRLSIRLTILKNGDFEQLICTGGSCDILKNNYENIAKIFPLKIDDNIVRDFPRYLRYSFKFNIKEE